MFSFWWEALNGFAIGLFVWKFTQSGLFTNWTSLFTYWTGLFTNWTGLFSNWTSLFTNWTRLFTNLTGLFTNWTFLKQNLPKCNKIFFFKPMTILINYLSLTIIFHDIFRYGEGKGFNLYIFFFYNFTAAFLGTWPVLLRTGSDRSFYKLDRSLHTEPVFL